MRNFKSEIFDFENACFTAETHFRSRQQHRKTEFSKLVLPQNNLGSYSTNGALINILMVFKSQKQNLQFLQFVPTEAK